MTAAPPFHPETNLLRIFQRHQVPFVVIGGHAVNFHGHLRATEDVDVVWVRSPDAEVRVYQALVEVNAKRISSEIDPATRVERMIPVTAAYIAATHLMMLVTDFGFLDLFDFVPGEPQADTRDLYAQAKTDEGIRYASLDWLVRMKKAAGRPQDRSDLQHLDPDGSAEC